MKLSKRIREINRLHKWLRNNHHKILECQNINCKRMSKTFDFALKKGFKYEYNRDNFVVLCRRCHKSYDKKLDNPKRTKMIMELRNNGYWWKEIADILGMDFRNVARDYKRNSFKVIINENK